MSVKVGINGFGRIGRNFLRAAKKQGAAIDIVADQRHHRHTTLAHLLKYDSVHGSYPGTVQAAERGLVVDGDEIAVSAERNPAELPWKELGADIVIESTGIFTDRDKAAAHLEAGAQEGDHLGPRQGRGHHHRDGRQPRRLRRGQAPRHLQRVVHHQLPGADGEGPRRVLRHRARAS